MVRRPLSAKRSEFGKCVVQAAEKFGLRSFQKISIFFEKVLTKKNADVFLETFPLKRKRFFEIYFVRLIGTPNQNIPKTQDSPPASEKYRCKPVSFSSS